MTVPSENNHADQQSEIKGAIDALVEASGSGIALDMSKIDFKRVEVNVTGDSKSMTVKIEVVGWFK